MNLLLLAVGCNLATASPGSNIEFPWGEKFGREYTVEVQKDPTSDTPFRFKPGESETQHCLGLDDADLFNARAAAFGVAFPIRANLNMPISNPRTGQDVLTNSERIFDENSFMYIHGVGYYEGPLDIGNYLAVPHPNVSNVNEAADNQTSLMVLDINTLLVTTSRTEKWAHLDPEYPNFDFANIPAEHVEWNMQAEFYPCSAIIRGLTVAPPDFTLQQFINAGEAPGAMQKTCTTLMKECVGDKQQFLDYDDCMDYMSSLPHVDPLCSHKYGGQAWQGNSFMCKYLHNFMASTQPELHCFHAGKGLMDHRGKRKCSPADCLLDSSPKEIQPVYLDEPSGPTVFSKNDDTGFWTETVADANIVPAATIEAANVLLKSHSLDKDISCTQENENELASATVYALAACLPFLGSNAVCSESCTQAINTYFGRYAVNNVLCSCSSRSDDVITRRSALLTSLDIDPFVLLNRCPPSTFKLPRCLFLQREGSPDSLCSEGTYTTSQGCQTWSYDSMMAAMYVDWSDASKMHGRITTSDDVAMAEGFVLATYDQWMRSSNMYHVEGPIHPSSWQLNSAQPSVHVHPGLHKPKIKYEDFLSVFRDPHQKRNRNSLRTFPTFFNGDAMLDKSGMMHVAHGTGSAAHTAIRRLLPLMLPGLKSWEDEVAENPLYFQNQINAELVRRNLTNEYLDIDVDGDIINVLLYVITRSTLPPAPHIEPQRWEDAVTAALKTMFVFRPRAFHVSHGELTSVASLSGRAQLIRLWKDIVPVSQLRIWVQESGWWEARKNAHPNHRLEIDNDDDVSFAYLDHFADMIAGPITTLVLIRRLRRDECELMPLWKSHDDRLNFVHEHMRLVGSNGAIVDDTMYPFLNAHLDEAVFSNPYEFNPGRTNLHQHFAWNAVYSDILDPPSDDLWFPAGNVTNTTVHRACPSRFFMPNFMAYVAPLFLPKNAGKQCANGHRIRDGVAFNSILFDVADDVQVEVLQAEGAGITENANRLLIMLSDFGEPPLVWGPTIGRLQNYFTGVPLPGGHTINREPRNTNTHYWAMVLPGQGKGSPLANCSFDYTSELIVNLITHAKEDLEYSSVYIVGRGLGGLVSWYVAQEAEVRDDSLLDGIVTFSPHPIMFTADHADKPFDRFFARPMIDPVLSTLYLGNTDLIEKIVFDRFDWDKYDTEYKMAWLWDYRRFWRQTGPERLTCYYRDNFYSRGGDLALKDPVAAADVLPEQIHVKLMDYAFDPFFSKPSVMKSAYFLIVPKPINGRILDYHSIKGRYSVENFFDEDMVDEVAHQVSSFVWRTAAQYRSTWQFVVDNVFKHKLEHQYNPYSTTGTVTVVFAFLMVMTGLLLEHLIGPYTWNFMAGHNGILLIPLMVVAVFDFGFPQANALFGRPFRQVRGITKFKKWKSFFDGVGVVIHHSGGFVIVAAVVSGRSPGLLFLFPGIPIMIEHLLASLNVFRNSTHPVYKYSVMAFLAFTEVWLYLEVSYLWHTADAFGAVGSTMIASGHVTHWISTLQSIHTKHVIWMLNFIAEIIRGMATTLHDKLTGDEPDALDYLESQPQGETGNADSEVRIRASEVARIADMPPTEVYLTIQRRGLGLAKLLPDVMKPKKLLQVVRKFEVVMMFAEDEFDIMQEYMDYHKATTVQPFAAPQTRKEL